MNREGGGEEKGRRRGLQNQWGFLAGNGSLSIINSSSCPPLATSPPSLCSCASPSLSHYPRVVVVIRIPSFISHPPSRSPLNLPHSFSLSSSPTSFFFSSSSSSCYTIPLIPNLCAYGHIPHRISRYLVPAAGTHLLQFLFCSFSSHPLSISQ